MRDIEVHAECEKAESTDSHQIQQTSPTLTLCFCHVTYVFRSESTLYSCLNVKKLIARSRCKIRSLSDRNWTRTQNHLVCKQKLTIWPNWQND